MTQNNVKDNLKVWGGVLAMVREIERRIPGLILYRS
jgi:hypothetical protein